MRNLRKVLALGVLGLGLSLATGASALSYVVTGPASGSYAPGTGLTFTVGLDQETSLQGFELFYTWTEAALDVMTVTNLFPDGFPAGTFPLTVDQRTLGDPTTGRGRVSSLQLAAFDSTNLFEITFQATGSPGDLTIFFGGTTGNGLSGPGGVTVPVANVDLANLFTFSVTVPEPSTLALLGLGCLGLVAAGRRRV